MSAMKTIPLLGGVLGPAGSVDNAIARFNGTSGQVIQASGVTIDDDGVITGHDIILDQITRIGDGSNHLKISANGIITLEGTARVTKAIDMAGATYEIGQTAPSPSFVGNYLVWLYDIGDDSRITFEVPHEWAEGTDIIIKADWGINRNYASENAEVQWNGHWSATPHDESKSLDEVGTKIDPGDQDIPASAHHLTRTDLGTISGGSLSKEDEIGIKVDRVALDDGNNPGAGTKPYLTHLYITYIINKLGEAT